MSHTPEPWYIVANTPDVISDRADDEGVDIAIACGLDDENEAANARRIVACVNACAGIATGALEAGLIRTLVNHAKETGAIT